jgi:hypothetical protein
LLETFPGGTFRGVLRLNRPGDQDFPATDFLGFYPFRLDDMRAWRASGRGTYPYPIFPEPGGLLPWASGPRLEQVFWLTADTDPDRWPVVLADAEFQRWGTHPGPAAAFLLDALEGRFDTGPFGFDLAVAGQPPLVPDEAGLGAAFQIGPGYLPAWDFFQGRGKAAGEYPALARLLGPPERTPPGGAVPWARVHERLGTALPADYRAFVDSYGPGRFGDLAIAGPGATGDGDLFALLLRRTHERLRVADYPCAVHPEPGGIVTWGETADGWTCGWAPTTAEPDRWGTVVITPDLASNRHAAEMSFSDLLCRYADPACPPDTFAGRPHPHPSRAGGGIRFAPQSA